MQGKLRRCKLKAIIIPSVGVWLPAMLLVGLCCLAAVASLPADEPQPAEARPAADAYPKGNLLSAEGRGVTWRRCEAQTLQSSLLCPRSVPSPTVMCRP